MTHSRGCVLCWLHVCLWGEEDLMPHWHTHHVKSRGKKSVLTICDGWWDTDRYDVRILFKVSSCVNWTNLETFLTFFHYCHFTWELGQQRGSPDSRLTPDDVHLIDISTDNNPFLHCSGGYIGRRWKGANTGEMSHQESQRGVKPCLTSAGSVAPLCPLCAPGKMI